MSADKSFAIETSVMSEAQSSVEELSSIQWSHLLSRFYKLSDLPYDANSRLCLLNDYVKTYLQIFEQKLKKVFEDPKEFLESCSKKKSEDYSPKVKTSPEK